MERKKVRLFMEENTNIIRFPVLGTDNRGSTLLEVIVSVLIIAIAFVPLMAGLNASLRVNKQTENELYAENVASNVIEICKTYKAKGMEDYLLGSGIDSLLTGSGSGASMTQESGKEEFTITNISSGTHDNYTATVVFSAAAYSGTGEQNDFSAYQSISGLDKAVIVSFETDNLEAVVKKVHDAATGTTVSIDDMKNHLSDWLERNITLNITTKEVSGKTKYIVRRKTEYVARKDCRVNGVLLFTSSTTTDYAYETQTVDEEVLETYNQVPTSIIVTYSQIDNSKTLLSDNLIINKTSDVLGEINVYALCSNGDTLKPSGFTLIATAYDAAPSKTDTSEGDYYNVNVYSNLNLTPVNCDRLDNFGEGSTGKQSKLKDVTVTVKDSLGYVVAKKTSTVIEFE